MNGHHHTFSRPPSKLNVLTLEGVHPNGLATLEAGGFSNIASETRALNEEELLERIGNVHYLGIRSRTQVTARVLEAASQLRAVGCFCIGTNQVDTGAARLRGVPVFNAPFSNTRSVAELVLAEAILLMRGIPHKNAAAHEGRWLKSAAGSFEARGKQLGIVGYGHIGTQVGLLAESLGMRVMYHDVQAQLALGNAAATPSLDALLESSDVVTLHVPEAPDTQNMIRSQQLAKMKPGAALINASRGTVVDIEALGHALDSGHLSGAAIDVFPAEPKSSNDEFVSPLRGRQNVILTPHVGGSTEEAQEHIGDEVAEKLVRYDATGTTLSAVNFPQVSLPSHAGTYRLLHIHRNQAGVMAGVNSVFSSNGINIQGQYMDTDSDLGYVVIDFDMEDAFDRDSLDALKQLDGTLRARILTR